VSGTAEATETAAAAFCAATPTATAPTDALARALEAALATGQSTWPKIALSPTVFAAHLGRHRAGDDAVAWLGTVRVADLYLACACAEGMPAAIDAFERDMVPLIDKYLRRNRPQPALLDELRQRIREKLLVGARKIADYSGRGTLTKWLEVVSLRTAIDVARERHELLSDESSDSVERATGDLELDYIKDTYRSQFKEALKIAIQGLDSEQRNMLRLHFVDGVTFEQLAALFHVHRATVVRHVAAARQAILDGARKHIERELQITADEVDSLFRLVRSRIDLSLSAFLTPKG